MRRPHYVLSDCFAVHFQNGNGVTREAARAFSSVQRANCLTRCTCEGWKLNNNAEKLFFNAVCRVAFTAVGEELNVNSRADCE